MMKPFAIASVIALLGASAASAGVIERACLSANRPAANRALCGCIQDAANLTLSGSDQKMAAKFFKDPHKAQEIRQSDRSGHERFWQKYKAFGQTAEQFCS